MQIAGTKGNYDFLLSFRRCPIMLADISGPSFGSVQRPWKVPHLPFIFHTHPLSLLGSGRGLPVRQSVRRRGGGGDGGRGGGGVGYDPAGLLGQLAEELRLQLGHLQALLDGVGGQHHVVVDAGRVQDHRSEQLDGLWKKFPAC